MKYLIASDIHGSALYCGQLLAAFDREAADRLVLLGDLLYHGPRNGLPVEYDPQAVAGMLNAYKKRILCVHGNCDSDVDQLLIEFPIQAEYAAIESGGRTVYLTHGDHYNIDSPLPMQEGDVLIYGHFHVQMNEMRDGCLFLNPGSVTFPKEDSWRGYILLEDGQFIWKDLDGNERMRS